MNKQFTLGAALLLLGSGIVGCSNTAEGVKDDTKDAGTAVQKTGEKAVATVDNSAKAAADNVKQAGADVATGVKNTGTAIQKGSEKAVAGTEAGIKNTGTAIQKGGEKAIAGTETAAANIGDFATVKPKVATAIDADPELSKQENAVIRVVTKDKKVVLQGRVKTNEMKKKAEDITKKTLADNKYTNIVVNQLTVGIH